LGRNYRINFGEIDIIARKKCGLLKILQGKNDRTIHFVEVKTLAGNNNFYPEEHVNYKKQNKYRGLAEIWLTKNKFPQNHPCQVDVAAVSINGESSKIDFFENAING
jgi:Holliday junction resolvase-like predicted endonuclease